MAKKCPAGCGEDVDSGHLLCWGCWWGLPDELRAAVNRARRRRVVAEHQGVNDGVSATGEYCAAVSAAIDSAKARVISKRVRTV